jgi:hypothetical protein
LEDDARMQVEWTDGWGARQSVDVASPGALHEVLSEIERRASAAGVATNAVLHGGDQSLSIVLGLGDISFVQWMGGTEGAYLGVDTGHDEDLADLVVFSYLGHYSELPRSHGVPYEDAIDEAEHFLATGGLSPRWQWSGYLGDTPAPSGARLSDG